VSRSGPRFDSAPHARARGSAAEDDAVRWLAGQGYEIVERNATTAAGEIDVVARDGETLCFIEIKARASDDYGPAIEAVDRRKQRRLARAAALYLALRDRDEVLCRFDVLGMDRAADGWRYTLVRDAFLVA
jgi:putative endonuclease